MRRALGRENQQEAPLHHHIPFLFYSQHLIFKNICILGAQAGIHLKSPWSNVGVLKVGSRDPQDPKCISYLKRNLDILWKSLHFFFLHFQHHKSSMGSLAHKSIHMGVQGQIPINLGVLDMKRVVNHRIKAASQHTACNIQHKD